MFNPSIKITTNLNQIAGIDEFKGEWKAIGNLAPERLDALKRVATIESITEANRNTIKVKLRELVNNRYLVRQGRGKGTRYTIGNVINT